MFQSFKMESGRGKGYSNANNMSVNAVESYAAGLKPIKEWDKATLISKITKINKNIDVKLLKKLGVSYIRDLCLSKAGRHHIGKTYVYTQFGEFDELKAEQITDEILIEKLENQANYKDLKAKEKAAKAAEPKKIAANWVWVFDSNDAKKSAIYSDVFQKLVQAEDVDFDAIYAVLKDFAARIADELTVSGVKYLKSPDRVWKTFIYQLYLMDINSRFYAKIKTKVLSLLSDFEKAVNSILN